MKLKKDFNVFVIVGQWNRHIFNEEWIKKNILPKDEFKFEIESSGFSHRVVTKNFRIEFSDNRIAFALMGISKIESVYEQIIDIANKIADYLPHTPVQAFGINFLFECTIKEIKYEFLNTKKISRLEKIGYKPINHIHKHSLKDDEFDSLVNITIATDKNKLIFDFNFNFEISNLTQLKEKLYDKTSKNILYDKAINILKKIYNIKKIK